MATLERESDIGGLGRGIGEGIKNLVAVRGIQAENDKEERALRQEKMATEIHGMTMQNLRNQQTQFEQNQQLWKEQNDPRFTVADILKGSGLNESGQKELSRILPQYGIDTSDPNKKFSYNKVKEVREGMKNDPEASGIVNYWKLRSGDEAIAGIERQLSRAGDGSMSGEQVQDLQNKKKALQSKMASNPLFQKRVEWENKREELENQSKRLQAEIDRVKLEGERLGVEKVGQEARLAHEKRLEKLEAEKIQIEKDKYGLLSETAHTDRATKYLSAISKKTPQVIDMGDGTSKVVMVDENPMSTLRKAFIMNRKLMEQGGFADPPKGDFDWDQSFYDAHGLLKDDARVQDVALVIQRAAKKEGVTFTKQDIEEKAKEYPNLKKIAKLFPDKEAKEQKPPASGTGIGEPGSPSQERLLDRLLGPPNPDLVGIKEGIKKGLGMLVPSGPEQSMRSRLYQDLSRNNR